MTVKEYMDNIRSSVSTKLIEPAGLYSGRNGHIRFAHEVGYALNDFDKEGQKELLQCSYSSIYARACFLKPILDAGEWVKLMKSQRKEI